MSRKHRPRKVKRAKIQGKEITSVLDLQEYPLPYESEEEEQQVSEEEFLYEEQAKRLSQSIKDRRLSVQVSRMIVNASLKKRQVTEDPSFVTIAPSKIRFLHVIVWVVVKVIWMEYSRNGQSERRVTFRQEEHLYQVRYNDLVFHVSLSIVQGKPAVLKISSHVS